MSTSDRIWTFTVFGGAGALLLAALPWLLDLLGGFPFIPFRDVADWLSAFDQWWAPVLRIGLGLLAGLALAVFAVVDEHRLEVGDEEIVVIHDRDRRTLRRDQVVGIHRDGKLVTIDGTEGRTLFQHTLEVPRARVREVFLARGWPWESD